MEKILKKIILIKDEQEAINKLIVILKNFAKATGYLGESKYITISLIYNVLAIINQKIIPVDDIEIVDLISSDIAFAT